MAVIIILDVVIFTSLTSYIGTLYRAGYGHLGDPKYSYYYKLSKKFVHPSGVARIFAGGCELYILGVNFSFNFSFFF